MVQNIISSLGGGSGIDTLKLVDDLVAIEREPEESLLDSREQKLEAQISGYGALRSTLSGIQDSAAQLTDSDTFDARSVSFPDTNLLTPTSVDAGAAAGEYTIEVVALAAAQSLSAGGFSDPDAVVGSGTLTFTFGDWAADYSSFTANGEKAVQNLTIDASNNTLSGIRDAINKADFGVQAAIVESGGSYTLQLTSSSGASNELQISVSEGSPAGLSALSYEGFPPAGGMLENQPGADASLRVNGLLVSRESNQISDVIEGLDFTLNAESVGGETATISIGEDRTFGEQVVRDFVEVYNLFLESVGVLTAPTNVDPDAEDQSPGSLSRDPTAKTMISQVRGLISQTITGLDGDFTALATVGIETQLDGSLAINEDLFRNAVDNNYSQLADLFTGTNSTTDARVDVVKTKSTTAPGTYDITVTTQPAKGYVTGGSVTVDDATALGLDTGTGSFGAGLNTSLGDYSFQVTVDGTTSNQITLSGTYADTDALIADMQAQINGDSNLSGVAAALDITYDTATASFTATSREYGSNSSVSFSNLSVDMARFALGGGASSGSLEGGSIVDAGDTALGTAGVLSTSGTINDTLGAATEIEDTSGALTTTGTVNGAAFPLTTDGTYTMEITVDGISSGIITPTAQLYNAPADLATELETQINGALVGASVTVTYDGGANKFVFTSNTTGAGSTLEITAASAIMGSNLGITAEAGIGGVTDAFVTPLDTSSGSYNFDIAIDGASAVSVALSGTYADAEAVRAALETEINLAGAAVTVGYDTATNRYTITSLSTGSSSNVEIQAVGADMTNLGFAVEAGTAGDDDTFTNPLDTSDSSFGGLPTYVFSISVDGGLAQNVNLEGTFATTEDVRIALQAQITGATVGYDAVNQAFTFTSDTTGSTSDVDISGADGAINNLGIVNASGSSGRDASTPTAGVDIAGTIDGVEAFGSGNILLPEIGSALAGLSLQIAPGVTEASITISRGFGNELKNVLDTYLQSKGLISERESTINAKLEDIDSERTDLDRRMESRRALLEAQFLAMERIISALNSTSNSLDGLLDRLPFTAKKQ